MGGAALCEEIVKLAEITVTDVLQRKNWVILADPSGLSAGEIRVQEKDRLEPADIALFSAIARLNDGSLHPALIVKNLAEGGLHTDTFLHTRLGWVNIFEEGFSRAADRYHGDIFPFDIYIARPWERDRELMAEGPGRIQEHASKFQGAAPKIKS